MKILFLAFAQFLCFGVEMFSVEKAMTGGGEIVRIGEAPFSLLRFKEKRWVVGVGFGAFGNSVSALYFHGEDTPGTALEESLPSVSPDRRAVLLAGEAQWLLEIWDKVGENVNPYAFENLRVSERKIFDVLLFSGMPFSVTEEGHFKISGVFPNFRSWRTSHALGKPENAFDFVYDEATGTWFDVTGGAREAMPSIAEISAEDWIGYAIARKNHACGTALPLPDSYDSARAKKAIRSCADSVGASPEGGEIRKKVDAVPAKVRRMGLPFASKKILRLEKMTAKTTGNGRFAFSAKICGHDFSFEYDEEAGRWRNLSDGEFLVEPESGEVSETLWLLRVLKKRGELDGVSPENYPPFGARLSLEELHGKTLREVIEMARIRVKTLREAILGEFSADGSSRGNAAP